MSGQFKKYGGRYNYQKNEIIQSDSVTTNYLQTKNFVSEYFDGTTRKYMLTINEDIISANDNRIQNVGDPFEPGDAINLEYFHKYNSDVSGGYVKRKGDTMIGLLNVSPETNYVTGLKNPLVVDNTNIYNKAYVDTNGAVKYLTDQTINTIQADSNIKVINNDGSTHMGHLWITDQISAGYIQSYDNGDFAVGKPQDAPCSLLLNPKGGKVGIGLAEPTEALDVNGSAIFSGSADIGQVKIWDMSSSGSYSNITTSNATMNIGMESSAANYSSSLISLNANNVNVSNIFTANNRIRLQANGYWSQLYFGSDKNNSGKESRLYISPNNSMGGPFSSNTVYIEAGLNMSGNQITGLENPSSDTDAVTLGYLKANYTPISGAVNFVKKSGDTMTGTLNMSNNKISGLANPVSATEAVSLGYLQANYSPSSDNTEFVKKSGDTMTGDLTVNGSGGIKSVWVGEYIVNNSSYNIITSSNGAGLYGQKGASNNQDGLLFRVNNTGTPYTGMALTSDGNIGIGTTTPGEKLDVYGTAQFNNATTGGNNFVNINSNGTMTINTSSSKEQQLLLSSSTGEHSHQLLFQVDYGTAVGAASPSFNDAILSSNGNLFIGSYGNKQPISGLTGNYAYTQYNNTTSSNSIIHNGDVTCNNSLSVKGILDMGGYKITSLANPASANEAVTLGYLQANYTPSSGATNFVKKSGDTMTGPLSLTSDGSAYLRFVTQAGKTFIESGRTTGKSTSDLYFSSMDGGQNNMVIKENGNVGIGTTSPSEKLYVNGTAQFNNGSNYVAIPSSGALEVGNNDHSLIFQVDTGGSGLTYKDIIGSTNAELIIGCYGNNPKADKLPATDSYPRTVYASVANSIGSVNHYGDVNCANDLTVNSSLTVANGVFKNIGNSSGPGSSNTFSFSHVDVQNDNSKYAFSQINDGHTYINGANYVNLRINNSTTNELVVSEAYVNINGTLQTINFNQMSDERMKHNIQPINNALDIIKKLNVKKYIKTVDLYDAGHNFVQDADGNYLDEDGNIIPEQQQEIGIIAQEVRENIPELTHIVHGEEMGTDYNGNYTKTPLAVNYHNVFSLNIQATQELAKQIDEQNSKIENIQSANSVNGVSFLQTKYTSEQMPLKGHIISSDKFHMNNKPVVDLDDNATVYSELCEIKKDTQVIGVYHSLNNDTTNIQHTGTMGIWVSELGGNIMGGEFIEGTEIQGIGQKQFGTNKYSSTVGKALHNCDFVKRSVSKQKPVVKTEQIYTGKKTEKVEITTTTHTKTEIVYDEQSQTYIEKEITYTTETKQTVYEETQYIDVNGNIQTANLPVMVDEVVEEDRIQYNAQGYIMLENDLDENGNLQYVDPLNIKYVKAGRYNYTIYNDEALTDIFYTYKYVTPKTYSSCTEDQVFKIAYVLCKLE